MAKRISAVIVVAVMMFGLGFGLVYRTPKPPLAPSIQYSFAYHQADEYGYYFAADYRCENPLKFHRYGRELSVLVKSLPPDENTSVYQCWYGFNILAKSGRVEEKQK